MLAREGGSPNILNVLIELNGVIRSLANKLLTPLRLSHFIAIRLYILQYLDTGDAAIRIDGNCLGNHLVLANHFIND